MYKLTYLGHQVTLPWLDLRSNFDIDLSRSNYAWFDAPWRDKHDGIKIVALPLKLKILSSKNLFGKFWNFDPWWPQFWPEPKNDRYDFEIIFSRAFERRFPFCSTMRRSRDRRGCSNTPIRWWKIQRPIRARVKAIPQNNLCNIDQKAFHVFTSSVGHSKSFWMTNWRSKYTKRFLVYIA